MLNVDMSGWKIEGLHYEPGSFKWEFYLQTPDGTYLGSYGTTWSTTEYIKPYSLGFWFNTDDRDKAEKRAVKIAKKKITAYNLTLKKDVTL